MKKINTFFLIFSVFIGCNHKKDINTEKIKMFENNEIKVFSDIFKGIEIIPLNNDDDAYFSKVTKFIETNDRYYIYSSKEQATFVFDKFGKFIYNTKKFLPPTNIADFNINPYTGHLEFLTPQGTLYSCDDKGNLLHNINFTETLLLNNFISLNETTYALYSRGIDNETSRLYIYSTSKNKILKEHKLNNNIFNFLGNAGRIKNPFVINDSTCYFFHGNIGRDIYTIHPESYELILKHELDFGDKAITPEAVKNKEYKDFCRDELHKYISVHEKFILKNLIITNFMLENNIYMSIYDKNKQESLYFRTRFDSGENILAPLFAKENELIDAVDATYIKEMLPERYFDEKTWDEICKYTDNDNYIIVKYLFDDNLFNIEYSKKLFEFN